MIETRFKDTEVGRIPVDWQLDRLIENFEFKANNTLSRDALSDSGIIQDVHYGDVLVKYGSHLDVQKDGVPYISDDRFNAFSFISDGDIIIADTAEDETVGKATEVLNVRNNKLVSGLHTMWLHPINQEKYVLGYLGYAFNASIYHNQLLPLMQGTKVTSVSKSAIKDTFILVPPKSEQTRIATALSKVDALISELGKLIEKKCDIKQGAIQQLLTGKKRLKGFTGSSSYRQSEIGLIPEDWVIKSVNEVSDNYTGLTYTPNDVGDFGTLVLRSSNIQDSMLRFDDNVFVNMVIPSRAIVHEGDILICVRNGSSALIGKCAYITQEADGMAFGAFMTILRATQIDRKFLYYVWQDARIQKQIHETFGATINQITAQDFKRIVIAMPTNLEEQSAISSVLSSMDNEISALESKKAKYELIKQGMMQQLLTGRIRLVETSVKTNTTSANVHFRRSVLAAEIADRLCEEPTFGHVKMEKMLFLTERLCHIDIGSHYHRDAAGPYDNNALRSIDSQLKKQKWFEVRRTEKGNRYVPMQNRGNHKTYFNRYYSDVASTFDKIINTFKTQRTEQCEIVATLYSAWEDLLHGNKSFSDADIVNEVLNNWHESKKRISRERWLNAIQWMRDNGFAPNV